MSYSDLARQLAGLASKIEKHASKLEGPALSKAAGSLAKAAAGFEKKMDAHLRGSDPSVEAIQNLLKSPAKKVIKGPAWKKLLKDVFRESAGEMTPAQMQKRYVQLAMEDGRAEMAFQALEKALKELSLPAAPIPKDKEALQAEFLRLGGLPEEDAMVELSTRWKVGPLKNLAKMNAIPVPEGVKRERLEREILHYARRAHINIRGA